jgi:glycosyltransferase involved in cell wall biosynthesis
VLANSEAVARLVIAEDHLPASRVSVIPNFVGPEAFEPYPDDARQQLLAGFKIPVGARVIGSVARLSPAKGHTTLVRAVAELRVSRPDLHLLLVGSGPMRDALATQARDAGLADAVHFAGTLPNSPNPHALFELSVLASLTEGFPNAVIEAMAAGIPIVATHVGGTPEAVENGSTGLLVPPADPAALARAIATLLDSPELRATFAVASRQRARRLYHADVVIERLTSWYEDLRGVA